LFYLFIAGNIDGMVIGKLFMSICADIVGMVTVSVGEAYSTYILASLYLVAGTIVFIILYTIILTVFIDAICDVQSIIIWSVLVVFLVALHCVVIVFARPRTKGLKMTEDMVEEAAMNNDVDDCESINLDSDDMKALRSAHDLAIMETSMIISQTEEISSNGLNATEKQSEPISKSDDGQISYEDDLMKMDFTKGIIQRFGRECSLVSMVLFVVRCSLVVASIVFLFLLGKALVRVEGERLVVMYLTNLILSVANTIILEICLREGVINFRLKFVILIAYQHLVSAITMKSTFMYFMGGYLLDEGIYMSLFSILLVMNVGLTIKWLKGKNF